METEKIVIFNEDERGIVRSWSEVGEIVRCKYCKHYREGKVLSPQKFCFRLKDKDGAAIGYNFAEDDFCSYGERSENGET